MESLYVIAVVSNPRRFASRYRLYREFAKRMECTHGAVLYTVEMAFGDRPFEVTRHDNPCHVQLRGNCEIWQKENLINIGISRLPVSARYIAWVDADVMFTDPNWAVEAVHALQHHRVVQLFSHVVELRPDHAPLIQHRGFVHSVVENGLPCTAKKGAYEPGVGAIQHPGYAWAARREVLDGIGGLVDFEILGSADWRMACAFVEKVRESCYPEFTNSHTDRLLRFERLCQQHIQMDVGCLKGTIVHYWHGKKRDRGYDWRYRLLGEYRYDPTTFLVRDTQHLLQLAADVPPAFRNAVRHYFTTRNEDSIDL